MQGVNRILVVVEREDDATLVLEKACQLATAADADIRVVRVVYEGVVDLTVHDDVRSDELRTFVVEGEETKLNTLVEPFRNRVGSLDAVVTWNRDPWQGVIDAAVEADADLVLKAAAIDEGLSTVLYTPADYNLLRHSDIPVMLVKPDAWVTNPVVLAAVDALNDDQHELSARVLFEAAALASILGGELDVVTAYPITEPWSERSPVGIDFAAVRTEIETTLRDSVAALAKEAKINYRYLHVVEGSPEMAIHQLAETSNTEILVMGTVAREGVKGVVMGNTSETILHHTHCDVVVLR